MKNLIYHPVILNILMIVLKMYMLFVRYTTNWKQIGGEKEIKAFWRGQFIYTEEDWKHMSHSSNSIEKEKNNLSQNGSTEQKTFEDTKSDFSQELKTKHQKVKGGVGGVWHGRLLMISLFWSKKGQQQAVMSSLSRDGEIGARSAKMAGMKVFRGSAYNPKKKTKSKRTISVYREMLRFINQGGIPFLTLDGPRGPRMRGGFGLVHMSKFSGAPIVLFSWSKQFRIVFKTWDKFILPLPFGKGAYIWAVLPPIPKHANNQDLALAQKKIETVLNQLCEKVDLECSVEPIKPAEIKRHK